jgi:hypothetical protein
MMDFSNQCFVCGKEVDPLETEKNLQINRKHSLKCVF